MPIIKCIYNMWYIKNIYWILEFKDFLISLDSVVSNKVYCNIFCQSSENKASSEILIISYYDLYHSDPIYWESITFSIDIYASNPPIFESELYNFTVNMWSNAIYILPNASDLDGDSFTTSVDGNNSFWVKINPLNMQQLVIYSSLLGPLATDTDYIIGIKLKDSTEAYTLNNFKITVPKYVNPYFDFIRDVKLNTKGISQISYKVNSKFSLNDLAYHISALDWNTNSLVPWIEQE